MWPAECAGPCLPRCALTSLIMRRASSASLGALPSGASRRSPDTQCECLCKLKTHTHPENRRLTSGDGRDRMLNSLFSSRTKRPVRPLPNLQPNPFPTRYPGHTLEMPKI